MSNNPNAQITMTNRERWALEGKAKQGWKCYFIERNARFEISEIRENMRSSAELIRNGEVPDIQHLTALFLDLYDKVGEICDCPVCYEPMTKDNSTLPLCGHMVCLECKPRLTECPICRKNY